MSDANVAVDAEYEAWKAEKAAERAAVEAEAVKSDVASDVPMIVHHETYMEGTVQHTRVHGPMPVSEWPEYERAHKL